jgi:hypothetical protein
MGKPPTSTIGLGRCVVSSLKRLPSPPAKITAFIELLTLTGAVLKKFHEYILIPPLSHFALRLAAQGAEIYLCAAA